MFDFIWNLLSFVFALGILVTVHEYGHFWVARKCGVEVQRFSVGFGQPLWRKTDKWGTEFVIALIPLGGYVKMLDERVDDVKEEDKHKAFNKKSVYRRIAIVGAGPFANFLFAIFAFYLMFLIGIPTVKPIVGEVEPQSIVAQASLPNNSELVEVAGKATKDWQDVNLALVGEIGSATIEVKAKEVGSDYVKSYQLNTENWQFKPESQSALTSLGIKPYRPKVDNIVAAVAKDSPANKGGLLEGDKLLAINGERLNDDWHSFSTEIKKYPNQQVSLLVSRQGQELELTVKPQAKNIAGKQVGYLGVSPKVHPWPEQYKIQISYGPIDAIGEGINRTWQMVTLSFDMIGKLITGDVSVKNLSGPISIAQGAGNSAGHGVVYFLGFLALISINLGIINLLPLPVLDGGHLLYYLIELCTGKPVPEKVQEIGFKFGAMALLGLMGLAIFNDLSRL
ncbi:sigma E protease regulator RseP [Thalassotalea sp. PLHSN55]|uniref:sigma E protease regulator RseP n=1 Tax=Thalassotalea sp. PLHSN55 TaxID=3435888 RepID=UPI003F87A8C5